MAHMRKEYDNTEKGPYPDKAGEYCGNHHPGSPALCRTGESPAEAERHQQEWLSRMRFGKPRPCPAGTTEEMDAQGYVGLYFKEDRPLYEWERAVETPEELTEPKAAIAKAEGTPA